MTDLSDAIAALDPGDNGILDRSIRDDADRYPDRPKLQEALALVALGADAPIPFGYLSDGEVDLMLMCISVRAGQTTWHDFDLDELMPVKNPPPLGSAALQDVFHEVALMLEDERKRRVDIGRKVDDALTDGLGIRLVGDVSVEPGDDDDPENP